MLELLLVLIVIGVTTSLVAPQIGNSLTNINLRTTAKKISAALRFAGSRAVYEMITYSAVFDLDNNRLSIVADDESGDADLQHDETERQEHLNKPKIYELPEGVWLARAESARGKMESGVFKIDFLQNGGNTGGDIFIVNERGQQYTISVNFITGAVKLR